MTILKKKWSRIFLRAFPAAAVAIVFSFLAQGPAVALAEDSEPETCKPWSFLAGYGFTHTGLGKTRTWVETVDLILRHEGIVYNDAGDSWYRGRHSVLIELPVHMVVDPDVAPIVGVNFLACWTFTSNKELMPYLFAGGGPLYTDAEIPGLGAHLNGNYQFGGGLRYLLDGGNYIKFEYRFHHISNAGAEDPNDPLNSSKFLIGITF